MLRFLKTKVVNGKDVTILCCWGFGIPISQIEFEEGYFFTGTPIYVYKNGRLWLSSNP
jgi:hypothetical protein